jgi:hypothetical protein
VEEPASCTQGSCERAPAAEDGRDPEVAEDEEWGRDEAERGRATLEEAGCGCVCRASAAAVPATISGPVLTGTDIKVVMGDGPEPDRGCSGDGAEAAVDGSRAGRGYPEI